MLLKKTYSVCSITFKYVPSRHKSSMQFKSLGAVLLLFEMLSEKVFFFYFLKRIINVKENKKKTIAMVKKLLFCYL